MAASGWSRRFDDPIPLDDGRALVTLHDAGKFIQQLSPLEQRREHWQAAAEALLLVVDLNGPAMLARIAMMRALHHGREVKIAPQRKRTKRYRIVK